MERVISRAQNQRSVGLSNKQLILTLLWERGPASRVELGKLTGLTSAALTGITRELLNQGLICELGQGESSVGRKPVRLGINKNVGRVAGIRLQKDRLWVAVFDLSGKLLARRSVPAITADVEHVAEAVRIQLRLTAEAAGLASDQVGTVVVVSPGLIARNSGVIRFSSNLGWHDAPLQDELQRVLHRPVVVEHIANAAAMAAYQGMRDSGWEDLVYVHWSVGIGAGIVARGKLFRGYSGFAGELGHVAVPTGDEVACRCGGANCLETVCGIEAILSEFGVANVGVVKGDDDGDNEDMLADRLSRLFAEETVRSRLVAERVGKTMGTAIANVVNLFNPQAVIIGGDAVALRQWLERPLLEGVNGQALKELSSHLVIRFDDEMERGVQGAGLLAAQMFLRHAVEGNPPFLSKPVPSRSEQAANAID